jgi:hypothetical protein
MYSNCPVDSKKSGASRQSLEYGISEQVSQPPTLGLVTTSIGPGFSPAPLHHPSIAASDGPDSALGTAAISDRPASHEEALPKQTHWLVLPPVHCQVWSWFELARLPLVKSRHWPLPVVRKRVIESGALRGRQGVTLTGHGNPVVVY